MGLGKWVLEVSVVGNSGSLEDVRRGLRAFIENNEGLEYQFDVIHFESMKHIYNVSVSFLATNKCINRLMRSRWSKHIFEVSREFVYDDNDLDSVCEY